MNNNIVRKRNLNLPGKVYAAHGSLKGEINLQWDAVEGAKHYIVQSAVTGGTNWKYIDIISEPQYTLSGLGAGKTYSFRVAPVFITGQGQWSEPVEKKVK